MIVFLIGGALVAVAAMAMSSKNTPSNVQVLSTPDQVASNMKASGWVIRIAYRVEDLKTPLLRAASRAAEMYPKVSFYLARTDVVVDGLRRTVPPGPETEEMLQAILQFAPLVGVGLQNNNQDVYSDGIDETPTEQEAERLIKTVAAVSNTRGTKLPEGSSISPASSWGLSS